MPVYINGIGSISAQQPWSRDALLADPVESAGDRLTCIEPDYTHYLDVRQLRRMSRIMKMGMACGKEALREAKVTIPNGIITGTSYGCLDDTGIFLSKMIENHEQALNPTPFIQSTHNTVGSQIALLLQCQGYNQTYTQRAFSFENSLVDAIMSLEDDPAKSFLTGAADEITAVSHSIQKRFGIFRRSSANSLQLFQSNENGTLNGEGAAYFLLSGYQATDSVRLEGVAMHYKPTPEFLKGEIITFLDSLSLKPENLDLVLLGKSGNLRHDEITEDISVNLFQFSTIGVFKHLTGEFPTVSAIAMSLACRIIQAQYIPPVIIERNAGRAPKIVLIYNPYFAAYHSLILLRAC